MHELDGAGGGGQLLRTALSLSALTGEPFRMTGIRETRPQPGLKSQHLAGVRAVARRCDADVTDARLESTELEFRPGTLSGGEYSVDVGTAGSIALVFDAVLPLAYGLPDGLRLHATGGTHVRWAPTMDHQRRVKLPLVRDVGLDASVWVTRHGFYPAGGGDATLTVNPSTAGRVDLLDRGPLEGLELRSVATESLSDADVGARQADTLFEALQGVGVPIERTVEYVRADSPGSALLLVANYASGRAGFSALGERGTAAERVAESVETAFEGFRRTRGVVDEHTADQLMIPLAVGGGSLTVPRVTDHVSSNAAVVRAFGGDVRVEGGEEGNPPRLVSPGGLV